VVHGHFQFVLWKVSLIQYNERDPNFIEEFILSVTASSEVQFGLYDPPSDSLESVELKDRDSKDKILYVKEG